MTNRKKERMVKGTCWALLLAVVFAFAFSWVVSVFPCASSRVSPDDSVGLFAPDLSERIMPAEENLLEEEEGLRDELLFAVVYRMFPVVVSPVFSSCRSLRIDPMGLALVHCPLLI